MQNHRPVYAIDSVDHALQLLLLLQRRGRIRVAEAAEELGVARSTAHRLLGMLRYHGFVTQDRAKVYRPGLVFYTTGLGWPARADLRLRVRPHLEWLNQQIDETVHLMVATGADVHFLDSVEATQALRVGSRIGVVLPAYRTSGGKALLAELPDRELHELYPHGLPAGPAAATPTMSALKHQLAQVRQQGYAVNREESEQGIAAVGMCLHDPDLRPLAAIAASAPTARLPDSRVSEIAGVLLQAIQRTRNDLAR